METKGFMKTPGDLDATAQGNALGGRTFRVTSARGLAAMLQQRVA
jgi:hypothetical protein